MPFPRLFWLFHRFSFALILKTIHIICIKVIIFATYGFAFFALFSRQSLDETNSFLYVVFAIAEIGLYLAWLKSTLIMVNPFGNDKDDFEV